MKLLRIEQIKLADIILPDDLPDPSDPEVVTTGKTVMLFGGPVNEPIVRINAQTREYELLLGRRCVAAHMLLRCTHITVKIVSCGREEADVLHSADNELWHSMSHRPPTDWYIEQLAERMAKRKLPKPRGNPGRPKDWAVEIEARKEGVGISAIRQRRQRLKVRIEDMRQKNKISGSTIITHGLEVPEAWLAEVTLVRGSLKKAADMIRKSLKDLQLVDEERMSARILPNVAEGLRQAATHAQVLIEQRVPHAVCPNCKLVPEVRANCAACETSGWVTLSQFADTPKALLDMADPIVTYGGKQVKLSNFKTAPTINFVAATEAQIAKAVDVAEQVDEQIEEIVAGQAAEELEQIAHSEIACLTCSGCKCMPDGSKCNDCGGSGLEADVPDDVREQTCAPPSEPKTLTSPPPEFEPYEADLVTPTGLAPEPDVMLGDPVDGNTPAEPLDDWGFLP